MQISTEGRKFRQNRVLYAENRNRIGVTYIGVQKSLEQTSIRKIYNIMETSVKFMNSCVVFQIFVGIRSSK